LLHQHLNELHRHPPR